MIREKRLGIWQEVDQHPLLHGEPAAGPAPGAGEEVVAIDPAADDDERSWLVAAHRNGAAVNVGDGVAPLLADLQEVQPTVMRARPELWEVLMRGAEARAAQATPLKRAAYRRRVLVKRKVRLALGLHRVRTAESTGALPEDVRAWYAGFGIPLTELATDPLQIRRESVASSGGAGEVRTQ